MERRNFNSLANISDPCKLRILVLPVGQITRKRFLKYFDVISNYKAISVESLLNSNISEKSKLEKKLFKLGQIQVNFVTDVNSSHPVLEEFQYFRKIVAVIGIADFEQCEDLADSYNKFMITRLKFSNAVTQRSFAFQAEDRFNAVEGITMVPKGTDSDFYIQISMFELIGKILLSFIDQLDSIMSDEANLAVFFRPNSTIASNQTNQIAHKKTMSFQKDFSSRVLDLASSVGLGSDQKAKRQQQGRQIKSIADLNLMVGRYPEAAKMYLKAIDLTRSNGDHLFYISSLEGYYCTILLIFSINADPADYFYKGEPEDLLMTIIESYLKELIKLYEETPHPLLYIEAYLKLAKLLTVVWKLGTTKSAIDACIRGDFDNIEAIPTSLLTEGKPRVTRADITAWVMCAWNPATEFLSLEDKISVFSTMSAIFGSLGYKRKEAFFLRHASIMLFPTLAKKSIQNEIYILADSDDIIKSNLEKICAGYRIKIGSNIIGKTEGFDGASTIHSNHVGWANLQKTVYKECIAIFESFSDFSNMAKYLLLLLFQLYPYLTKTEQEESYQTLHYLAECYCFRDIKIDFASIFPHMIIFNRINFDNSRALYPLKTDISTVQTFSNPLMLNFRKETLPELAPMLVVEETTDFEFIFTNPFRIPLEFEEISLLAEGIEFSCTFVNRSVPPKESISFCLPITPLSAGRMKVIGIKFLLLGSIQQEFIFKGLSSLHSSGSSKSKKVHPDFEIDVISPQPYLKITEASLAQPSLVLYEGERYKFSITLKNESKKQVNFIEPTFEEKTNTNVKKLLKAEDIYEQSLEKNTSLFTWIDKSNTIDPGEKKRLVFEAYGKLFCTHGTLIINYGYFSKPKTDAPSKRYCRKKNYHLNISVNPVVSPIDFDIISGTEAGHILFKKRYPDSTKISYPQELSNQIDRHLFCLLVLTYKNLNNDPLKLQFKIDFGDNDQTTHVVQETISGFDCKRIMIPFKRIGIENENIFLPIPKFGQSEEVNIKREMSQAEREEVSSFWYKEHLLRRISTEWSLPEAERSGSISLRWIRLDARTKPLIQLEEVWLRASLEGEENRVSLINSFHYQCMLGKPVVLNIDLFNRRDKPLRPCIRIQPYLDYHNGHFEAADIIPGSVNNASSNLRLEQASPLMVLGRSQEIFDEIPPQSSAKYSFHLFPTGIGKFRIGCSCQDLGELIESKNCDSSHFDSASLFLDVAPLVLDIVNV